MKTAADIQSYLMKMELPYEELRDGDLGGQGSRGSGQH